jgi:hypothetical protein
MAKLILFLLLLTNLFSNNIFQNNCLKCHNQDDLTYFIKEYTLKFSSKKNITQYMYKFLRNPTSNIPIMPYNFIIKHGYKTDTNLTNEQLKKAIDIYYNQYNIQKNIK